MKRILLHRSFNAVGKRYTLYVFPLLRMNETDSK